jgi:hypothetical protein
MANQPEAGIDPRIVQKVIQDAAIMEQEGQTRVMISRQLFQQLQVALQQFYGNSQQVDKMFEAEQALLMLDSRLTDMIEFGSGGIGRLGRKASGLLKKQQRTLKETDRLTWRGTPKKGKDIVYGAKKTRKKLAQRTSDARGEVLARRKGRMVSKQGKIARGDARRWAKIERAKTKGTAASPAIEGVLGRIEKFLA